MKIKPEFTRPQAAQIRLALKDLIEFRSENGYDYRAAENALNRLDAAELAARRR